MDEKLQEKLLELINKAEGALPEALNQVVQQHIYSSTLWACLTGFVCIVFVVLCFITIANESDEGALITFICAIGMGILCAINIDYAYSWSHFPQAMLLNLVKG